MEAQETAENLLLFSADIGKELEKVDKASGGDRRSEKFKIDGNVKNEKTKPETIHEMGFTDRQDFYSKMSKTSEIGGSGKAGRPSRNGLSKIN